MPNKVRRLKADRQKREKHSMEDETDRKNKEGYSLDQIKMTE